MSGAIPRLIHQIWLGGEPPRHIRSWMDTWRSLHGRWEYRLWTDDDVASAETRSQIERADSYAAKADILRVEVLRKYGGVYVDADYEAHRPIDSLIESRTTVLLSEGPYLTNSFMATTAGHPLMMSYHDHIVALPLEALATAGDAVLSLTGPLALTRVVSAQPDLLGHPGFVMLASDYFLVPKTRQLEVLHMAEARRFATHHAEATWRDSPGLLQTLRATRLRTRLRRFVDLSAI